MHSNEFEISGINGKCSFDKLKMNDGLRLAGYASRLQNGSVDDSADAMERIGLIALKYLKVNGEKVNDLAGLNIVCTDEGSSTALLNITLKFMEGFEDFLG